MLNNPLSPWPSFTEEEADAVREVLLSNKVNYWTGQEVKSFEKEFAEFSDSKHAIAVANGTVALDLALKCLGLSTGDEVIVTPRTFVASASSIVNCGATPVFTDIDRDSQNITPASIEKVITSKTKAIVCVHLAGWPCEMEAILALAKSNGLYVIEDCAQAHGAQYMGRSVGSFGDVSCWSFCQDKIMSTGGEGGMVTTNNTDLFKAMWSYKDHGKGWDKVFNYDHPQGFRWLHESFGTNYRMTEIQAKIGRIQLGRMDAWTKARNYNCQVIWDAVKDLKLFRVPTVPSYIKHAGYKCYLFVDTRFLKPGWDRDRIQHEINAKQVPCLVGSCSEVYLENCFKNAGMSPDSRLDVARELGETSLMFLVHPTLKDEEIKRVAAVICEVGELATN